MKKLVKGVAAALAVTMLAGCGASASSSTTEQASSSQATAQTTTADGKSVIRVGMVLTRPPLDRLRRAATARMQHSARSMNLWPSIRVSAASARPLWPRAGKRSAI